MLFDAMNIYSRRCDSSQNAADAYRDRNKERWQTQGCADAERTLEARAQGCHSSFRCRDYALAAGRMVTVEKPAD